MKRTLLETIFLNKGNLYGIINHNRINIAKCSPKIEIYEDANTVPILNGSYSLKTHHVSIILCEDVDCNIDLETLKQVKRFEMTGELLKDTGVYEVIRFDDITPNTIDIDGVWEFETTDKELIKKLLRHV